MTNAEAWFNIALRPRKPEGSLGRTAQDGHLDSHTAPGPCFCITNAVPYMVEEGGVGGGCVLRSVVVDVFALQERCTYDTYFNVTDDIVGPGAFAPRSVTSSL